MRKQQIAALLVGVFCITVLGIQAKADSDMKSTATITFYHEDDDKTGNEGGGSGGGTDTGKDKGGGSKNNTGSGIISSVDLDSDTVIIVDPEIPLAHPDTLPETGGVQTTTASNPYTGSNGLAPGLLCLAGALLLITASQKDAKEKQI